MGFLSAAFLWGLPLVTVPVIIHLIHRRRREIIRWGAMRFLLQAATRRRRIWRIEDLLLMLLRAAAVAAICFALARPLVHASWLGRSGGRDVVLVLDTSMSTARLSPGNGEETVFGEELRAAEGLIGKLGEKDTLRVLLASGSPEWLTPGAIPMSAAAKTQMLTRLEEIEPTLGSADMPASIGEAAAAEKSGLDTKRIVAVITDGQAYGWRIESAEAWGKAASGGEADARPASVNIVTAGEPGRPADNLSISEVRASRALVGTGETVVLTAQVKNAGDVPSEGTLLAWRAGEEELGVATVPGLEPGETTSVSAEHVFDQVGVYRVAGTLRSGDDLPPDDEGRFVVEVIDSAPVLIVDDTPRKDWLRTESGYLAAALGSDDLALPAGWRSVFRPKRVRSEDLGSEDLSNYRCVVLANSSPPEGEEMDRLLAYVRAGGGLWIVLGDKTDPVEFNSVYYSAGEGLCALPLTTPIGDEEDTETYATVYPPSANHPATRLLADTERLDIDKVHIYRRHRFQPVGDPGEVSVLLKTLAGEALAVERTFGRGRVIVQAFPLRAGWSNLPACQSFVVLAHEWLWYLAEPTAVRWNLEPGETFSVSFPGEVFQQRGTVATPRGAEVEVTGEARGERWFYTYAGTALPGDYTLRLADASGRETAYPFTVKRDPEESNLAPLEEAESSALSTAGGLVFTDDPLAMERVAEEAPPTEPLWPWVLLLILVMMAAEVLLAGRITGKRNPRRREAEETAGA